MDSLTSRQSLAVVALGTVPASLAGYALGELTVGSGFLGGILAAAIIAVVSELLYRFHISTSSRFERALATPRRSPRGQIPARARSSSLASALQR